MPETSLQELNGEIWCRIEEYPDYAVSDLGRVMRLLKDHRTKGFRFIGHFGNPHRKGGKYAHVKLYKDQIFTELLVHRLVALHHVPNPNNKPCVNHKDGSTYNNAAANLEWVTVQENNQHAYDTGLNTWKRADLGIEEIVPLYRSGLSIEDIGARLSTSGDTIWRRLIEAGEPTRPVGHQGRRWTQL